VGSAQFIVKGDAINYTREDRSETIFDKVVGKRDIFTQV